MPVCDLAVRLDACDHAGDDVVPVQHGAINFQNRLPGEAGELAQQIAVEAEEQAEALRSRGVYRRWSWCRHEWDALTTENVQFTMDVLERIAVYCKQNQIKLLLTGVPHYSQFAVSHNAKTLWSRRPHLEIEKVARRAGVLFFDSHRGLSAAIDGTPQHEYYYRDDMHFNPKGYRIWSDLHIEAFIEHENVLLPESVLK